MTSHTLRGTAGRQMTTEDVPAEVEILSAEKIEAELDELRESGFPGVRTEWLLDSLISSCRKAEPALAEIVQHLDEATVWRQLHARLSETPLRPSQALESRGNLRPFDELTALGCQVIPGDGWRVSMLDGTRVDSMLEPLLDEEPEVRLGRILLFVVGIIGMRDHAPLPPPF